MFLHPAWACSTFLPLPTAPPLLPAAPDGPPSEETAAHYAGAPLLVIPRDEGFSVDAVPLAVGECALARGIDEVAVKGGARALIARPL